MKDLAKIMKLVGDIQLSRAQHQELMAMGDRIGDQLEQLEALKNKKGD